MAVRVVVGAQWGDEGKGKIVDYLGERADAIARFAGGPNAGHTVVIGGEKTILHHVPSGALHDRPQCLLGNGVVVDARVLAKEIATLEAAGVPCQDRLRVSSRAHVILSVHRALEAAHEESQGERAIGTTRRGIGPAYSDKINRRGLRVGDLVHTEARGVRVRDMVHDANAILTKVYGATPLDLDEVLAEAQEACEILAPLVADTGAILRDMISKGREVLLEGAQGALLDIDHGTYPFATSSSATAGGAAAGTGIGPTAITDVWGIAKAYCTRVGNGPFPSELLGAEGDALREAGGEYGATTGRPRRCGWFDAVAARYAVDINGMSGLAITKLDILTGLDPLRVCVGYRLGGERIDEFPDRIEVLSEVEPIFEELPGWKESIDHARHETDLPTEAREYLARLTELTGCPVRFIGVGADREALIETGMARPAGSAAA